MKKVLILILACLLLSGCASVGNRFWYAKRLAEIEQMKKNNSITNERYDLLKREAAEIRQEYICQDRGIIGFIGDNLTGHYREKR